MRLLTIFVVFFIFCASTEKFHSNVYVDNKTELNKIIKNFDEKRIKYKIVKYDVGIYEIQYNESKK